MTIVGYIMAYAIIIGIVGFIVYAIITGQKENKEEKREITEFILDQEKVLQTIIKFEEIPFLLTDITKKVKKEVIEKVKVALSNYAIAYIDHYLIKIKYLKMDQVPVEEFISKNYNEFYKQYETMTKENIQRIKENLISYFYTLEQEISLEELCAKYLISIYTNFYIERLTEAIRNANILITKGFDEYIKEHPEVFQLARQNDHLEKLSALIDQRSTSIYSQFRQLETAIDQQTHSQFLSALMLSSSMYCK